MNKYIYKITFQSGKTYIGQRSSKNENVYLDKYQGNSSYAKRNPQDKIIKKEILISGDFDTFLLNLLETDSIIFEQLKHKNSCVNGNLGGLYCNFKPRGKGEYKPSVETIEKLRKARLTANPEINKKISNSVEKLWQDPAYRTMQSNSHKNKKSHLGFKNTPEQIKHISDGHKGIRHSVEQNEKTRKFMLERMCFMRDLYLSYKEDFPEIKWNDFLSKYSKGEI